MPELTTIREAVRGRALAKRLKGCSVEPHELEVKRWISICAHAVLTDNGKGAYSAAVCLLAVVYKSNDMEVIFPDKGDALVFMGATVRENCAYALEKFHEAYPDGYK